jgi:hypothetical protein
MAVQEYASVSHDGVEVISNTGTEAELREELRLDPLPPTDADADPGDDAPPAAAQAAAQDEPVKGKDAKPRIDKLTFEREQAKREADEAKAEAARLREELGRYKAKGERVDDVQPPKPYDGTDPTDLKPSVAEFEDHDAYLDARDAWNERRIERKGEAQRRVEARTRSMVHHEQGFATRYQEATAKDPGLPALLQSSGVQIQASGPMPDVIRMSPVGVEMLRYLATHKAEADRLNAITHPMVLFGEMKALEGAVNASMHTREQAAQAGSVAPVKPATKAHPPIQPVVGSPVTVADDGPPGDDASDDAHYAFWNDPKNRAKYGR